MTIALYTCDNELALLLEIGDGYELGGVVYFISLLVYTEFTGCFW